MISRLLVPLMVLVAIDGGRHADAARGGGKTPAELRREADYYRRMGTGGSMVARRTRAGNIVPWRREYTEERWREISTRVDDHAARRAGGEFVSTDPWTTGIPASDTEALRLQNEESARGGVRLAEALERQASAIESVTRWNAGHQGRERIKLLPGGGVSMDESMRWRAMQDRDARVRQADVDRDGARSTWAYSTRKRFVPTSKVQGTGVGGLTAPMVERARVHLDGLIASWHAQPAVVADERTAPARLTTIPGAVRSLGVKPFDAMLLDARGHKRRYQPSAALFLYWPGKVSLPRELGEMPAGGAAGSMGGDAPGGYQFLVTVRGTAPPRLLVANGVTEDAEWFDLGPAPAFLGRAVKADLGRHPSPPNGDAAIQHTFALDGKLESAGPYVFPTP